MIFIYIILNIFYCIYSHKKYHRWINPITIYAFPWVLMLSLFEMKLNYYYDLTSYTWFLVIVFQLIYNLGCYFGIGLSSRFKYHADIFEKSTDTNRRNSSKCIVLYIYFFIFYVAVPFKFYLDSINSRRRDISLFGCYT